MKKLTIIIPIYNEEKTLNEIVRKVQAVYLPAINKEIIIVDDSSKDKSKEIMHILAKRYGNIKLFYHEKNAGKGAAIRTGIKNITGDYMVIQDGDLEYNPHEFKKLIKPLLSGESEVVYGSRVMGHIHGFKISSHYYGNLFLSFVTGLLYGQKITDMETCYKMMSVRAVKSVNLKANRFDIEPEITAKLIKAGFKIKELPIDYNSRSFEEGKKITWKDGVVALFTLVKYRFFD